MPKPKGFAEDAPTAGLRRATNVSLDPDLLQEAKAFGVNISRACERGLAEEVASAKEKRWLEENAEALDAANAYVKARRLPLARHRKF